MPGLTRSNTSYMQLRKIEILEGCVGRDFAYAKGVHEVPADLARQLISDGLARPHKEIQRAIKKTKRVSKADNGTDL